MIVETYRDTFKYKKYVETERDWRRLRRLWKPLEIHVCMQMPIESQ